MADSEDSAVQKAEEAIDELFSDRSVPQSTTRERLEEIIDYIRSMTDSLEE